MNKYMKELNEISTFYVLDSYGDTRLVERPLLPMSDQYIKAISDFDKFKNTKVYEDLRTNKFTNEDFIFLFSNYSLLYNDKVFQFVMKKIKDFKLDSFYSLKIYKQFKKNISTYHWSLEYILDLLKVEEVDIDDMIIFINRTGRFLKEENINANNLSFLLKNTINRVYFNDDKNCYDSKKMEPIYTYLYKFLENNRTINLSFSYYIIEEIERLPLTLEERFVLELVYRMPYIDAVKIVKILEDKIKDKRKITGMLLGIICKCNFTDMDNFKMIVNYIQKLWIDLSISFKEIRYNNLTELLFGSVYNSNQIASLFNKIVESKEFSQKEKIDFYNAYLLEIDLQKNSYLVSHNIYYKTVIGIINNSKEFDSWLDKNLTEYSYSEIVNSFIMEYNKKNSFPSAKTLLKLEEKYNEIIKIKGTDFSYKYSFYPPRERGLMTYSESQNKKKIIEQLIKYPNTFYNITKSLNKKNISPNTLINIMKEVKIQRKNDFVSNINVKYIQQLESYELILFKNTVDPFVLINSLNNTVKTIEKIIMFDKIYQCTLFNNYIDEDYDDDPYDRETTLIRAGTKCIGRNSNISIKDSIYFLNKYKARIKTNYFYSSRNNEIINIMFRKKNISKLTVTEFLEMSERNN